ncbi:MAG: lactate utilization protein [Bacteroidota bacterium]|nr:lactate utilization protein [Bacteroidota bacterium]
MKEAIINHAQSAKQFNTDEARVNWHDETLWMVRSKRDKAAKSVEEWETLRSLASSVKEHTLSNLNEYLIEFEKQANKNGVKVYWAADAKEHNEIVLKIINEEKISKVVKSKSMLTEECHLNKYLEQNGIEVVDTDLGERIVQFRKEIPSHIVLPAIHLKKSDVSETFNQYLGTEKNNTDPQYLTSAARVHLREKFLSSEVAITGVNFAIAETGAVVVCTNEGNADMGVHAARVHIASMGIEKIIPKANHLGIFLRLLARSATGQPITTYSSHYHRAREGASMHIVIVDNGRSRQLANENFRNSLKCIRCGACFNTCPVYRRSSGHSYHNAIAGPIGSVLAPNMDKQKNYDLPFASTLCGSCTNVCPVKINLHEQLWKWRQLLTEEGYVSVGKKMMMKIMAFVLSYPLLYQIAGKSARFALTYFPFMLKIKKINPWYVNREMPQAPKQSFTSWYIQHKK